MVRRFKLINLISIANPPQNPLSLGFRFPSRVFYPSCGSTKEVLRTTYFPTARGSPRSRRQHKKSALLVTIIRNQGRGVKCRPEGGHTPLQSPREILFAIGLEIEPSELPEQPVGDQRIFHHH